MNKEVLPKCLTGGIYFHFIGYLHLRGGWEMGESFVTKEESVKDCWEATKVSGT
jgi:hypothetical protein